MGRIRSLRYKIFILETRALVKMVQPQQSIKVSRYTCIQIDRWIWDGFMPFMPFFKIDISGRVVK